MFSFVKGQLRLFNEAHIEIKSQPYIDFESSAHFKYLTSIQLQAIEIISNVTRVYNSVKLF